MTTYGKIVTLVAAAALGCAAYSHWKLVKCEHRIASILAQDPATSDEEVKKEIAAAAAAAAGAPSAESPAAGPAAPQTLAVEKVSYDGDDEIKLVLSQRPDMDVVREYVTVEPLSSGVVSFRYTTPWGDHPATGNHVPTLTIGGDFAYRTNVTLRVRKGFPAHGATCAALAEDFTYAFTRKDAEPCVDFADAGRYLPPLGARAIAVRSVNVPEVEVAVRNLPAENAVFALALEEGEYSRIDKSWARSDAVRDEFFRDLAGEPVVRTCRTANELNRPETVAVPVGLGEDGGNGLYLVRASIAGKERDDDSWWSKGANQYRFRLVCVSDLGLSVRRIADGSMLAWINSFATGRPVEGAEVLVYSPANVLVAKGRTDADGLCRPDRIADGEPFAVVARAADGSDSTFIALRDSMKVDETRPDGARPDYLKPDGLAAFLWTERGIYRHGEPMLLHALVRNGASEAMPPMPVEVRLSNPSGRLHARKTFMTDSRGSFATDAFSVGDDQPSGAWTLSLWTSGENGVQIGERAVKVEEFAPPQIRVRAEAQPMPPQDFEFAVGAEHLYGGAAKGLACEGAVVFEDVDFAPSAWKGYRFGNEDRAIRPSFRRLGKAKLDGAGRHVFKAPLWESSGLPRAAVRATGQGTVFEDGGRPACARKSVVCHYYPFYIGATLSPWMARPAIGYPQVDVACVMPDGRRVKDPRRLAAKIERVDTVYAYRKRGGGDGGDGWAAWDCERVRTTVADGIDLATDPDGDTVLTLPVRDCGDYVLTINDRESDASFAMAFYLSDGGDEGIRAPLSQPAAVTVAPDKAFYRVGETPRLMVKSPFTGVALVTLVRDRLVWRDVVALTNATAELTLPATATSWAPSADVEISVVQAVTPGDGRFAVRAHGQATIAVRPAERELPVKVDAVVSQEGDSGAKVKVAVSLGADVDGDVRAVVTLVDEGINLLTGEKTPDPVGFFAQPRSAAHPLYDLYHRLLPVVDAAKLKAGGVKTGGGFGAEMLSRVSPVPTRRFKPLAMWRTDVPLRFADGEVRGEAEFALPEFAGEIRVTALVYGATSAGAAAVTRKVSPKIVAQPDAPRFAAPGDEFAVTLPISNRSGADGEAQVAYSLEVAGPLEMLEERGDGAILLAKDELAVLNLRVKATGTGEGVLKFRVSGLGETHSSTILLPVRPAAAWRETAGVDELAPGATKTYGAADASSRRSFAVGGSRLAELGAALEWLADYPHGCLEQTASRIFPLVTAGGILAECRPGLETRAFVEAGVRRVESMVRANDFVMWPDCGSAPWDREVSLYAAHFLVEAERCGFALNPAARPRVMKFLSRWAMSTNDVVSAYACHTLALAGRPEKDRMLRLYDRRGDIGALSRSRLARAFTAIDDRARARELLALSSAPQSVKEAAFSLLAMLELDPEDARIPPLVVYLAEKRDAATFSWGTTESNAHALLALGEYYRHRGWKGGEPAVARHDNADGSVTFANTGDSVAFVSWRRLDAPPPESVRPEESVIAISRRLLDADGNPVDAGALERGDLVQVEIALRSAERRIYSDLVVEDLLPAAFEPVRGDLQEGGRLPEWVLRTDARDDRVLVYSRRFTLEKGETAVFRHCVRVVTPGEFVFPAAAVEAMYAPEVRASTAAGRIAVRDGERP